MAGTLSIKVGAVVENDKYKDSWPSETLTITQDAQGAHCPVVSVGTSEEDLPVGDITTLGWIYLKNLDGTNYVTYGPKSGGAMVALGRLEAGEAHQLRLEPGITLRWKANSAAVLVQVKLHQD